MFSINKEIESYDYKYILIVYTIFNTLIQCFSERCAQVGSSNLYSRFVAVYKYQTYIYTVNKHIINKIKKHFC